MAAFRKGALPLDVVARLGLGAGERVLGWATLSDAGEGPGPVVATDRALYLPEPLSPRRTPWDLIVRAGWEEPVLELVLQAAPGARPKTLRAVLDDPRDLADVVHAQVTGSVVVQQHLDLGTEGWATAVARRVPDTGGIRWSVQFAPGLDPTDAARRSAADRALRDLRSALGL